MHGETHEHLDHDHEDVEHSHDEPRSESETARYAVEREVTAERMALMDEVEAQSAQGEAERALEESGITTEQAEAVATAATQEEAREALSSAAPKSKWEEALDQIRVFIETMSLKISEFFETAFRGRQTTDAEGSLSEASSQPPGDIEGKPNNSNINLQSLLDVANNFGFARYSIESVEGNSNRPALVIVPRNYDPTKLSVICHGTGGNRGIGENSNGEQRLNGMLRAAAQGNAITVIPFAYDGAEDGVQPGELAGRGTEGSSAITNGYDSKWFSREVNEDFPDFLESILESDSLRNLNLDVRELVIQGFSAGGVALSNIARDYGQELLQMYDHIEIRYLDAVYAEWWAEPAVQLAESSRASVEFHVLTDRVAQDAEPFRGRTGVTYQRHQGVHGDAIDYSMVA